MDYGNVIYAKYNRNRHPKHQTETKILQLRDRKYVIKKALHRDAFPHIMNMKNNYCLMKDCFSLESIAKANFNKEDEIYFDYVEGKSFEEIAFSMLTQKNSIGFIEILKEYINFVKSNRTLKRGKFIINDDFLEVFGRVSIDEEIEYFTVSNIDLIFDNIFLQGDQKIIIDYEWVFSFPIPANYILYRSINIFISKFKEYIKNVILIEDIYKLLNISEMEIKAFIDMESEFQKYVFGVDFKHTIKPSYVKEVEQYIFEKDHKVQIQEKDDIIDKYQIQLNKKIISTLYYDIGEGFSERFKIQESTLVNEDRIKQVYKTNKEQYGVIKEVRWDPIENNCCIVELDSIYFLDGDDKIYPVNIKNLNNNGVYIDNMIVFDSIDPMIFIPVTNDIDPDRVFISGKINVYENSSLINKALNKLIVDGLNRENAINNQQEKINELLQTVHLSREEIQKQSQTIKLSNNKIESQHEEQITAQKFQLELKENQIIAIENELVIKENKIKTQVQKLDLHNKTIQDQQQLIKLQEKNLKEQQEKVISMEKELLRLNEEVNSLNKEISSILNSNSWKITEPFRKLKSRLDLKK